MGKVVKSVVGGILGGILGKEPKVANASPVSDAAAADVADAATKAKASRAALFETEGGAAGSSLDPNQVQKRGNLFGN